MTKTKEWMMLWLSFLTGSNWSVSVFYKNIFKLTLLDTRWSSYFMDKEGYYLGDISAADVYAYSINSNNSPSKSWEEHYADISDRHKKPKKPTVNKKSSRSWFLRVFINFEEKNPGFYLLLTMTNLMTFSTVAFGTITFFGALIFLGTTRVFDSLFAASLFGFTVALLGAGFSMSQVLGGNTELTPQDSKKMFIESFNVWRFKW